MPTVYSPPVSTYVPLATYTVTGSADASVDFVSIPATYRDLILVVGNMSTTAANTVYARLNGDTGSNYSYVIAGTNGAGGSYSISSATQTGMFFGGAVVGTNTSGVSQSILQIMDYSATDKHTTGLSRYSNPAGELDMAATRWANTDAVNSVTCVVLPSGSYNVGTTFSLYGIAS